MSVEQRPEIEALYGEGQSFPPDPDFAAHANATAALYEEAERDPEAFWARVARERVSWFKPFDTTLEWDLPFAKWFVGGELNISYNCAVFSASTVRIGAETLLAAYCYLVGGGHDFDRVDVPVVQQARPSRGIVVGPGGTASSL